MILVSPCVAKIRAGDLLEYKHCYCQVIFTKRAQNVAHRAAVNSSMNECNQQ